MLTSQYRCYQSRQEASSIDWHVENREEFLPLFELEVEEKNQGKKIKELFLNPSLCNVKENRVIYNLTDFSTVDIYHYWLFSQIIFLPACSEIKTSRIKCLTFSSSNWSPPKAATQGLIPPVPRAISIRPSMDSALQHTQTIHTARINCQTTAWVYKLGSQPTEH